MHLQLRKREKNNTLKFLCKPFSASLWKKNELPQKLKCKKGFLRFRVHKISLAHYKSIWRSIGNLHHGDRKVNVCEIISVALAPLCSVATSQMLLRHSRCQGQTTCLRRSGSAHAITSDHICSVTPVAPVQLRDSRQGDETPEAAKHFYSCLSE